MGYKKNQGGKDVKKSIRTWIVIFAFGITATGCGSTAVKPQADPWAGAGADTPQLAASKTPASSPVRSLTRGTTPAPDGTKNSANAAPTGEERSAGEAPLTQTPGGNQPASLAPASSPASDTGVPSVQPGTAATPPTPPSPAPKSKSAPQASANQRPKREAKKHAAPSAVTVPKPAAKGMTLSELARMYPDTFIRGGPAGKRQVALTFDDAPDAKFTPQVLDVLKTYRVKATFFLVGYRAAAQPEIVKRMVREGHVIGNHSYNHPNFAKLSLESFTKQIEQTQQILKPLIGYSPRFVRPPYGEIKQEQLEWAAARHLTVVNWNVDSQDWKQLDAEHVSANILTHVGPGSIVLQHSGGGTGQDLSGTVKALPGIIEKLRAYGFKLVTLPEMLDLPKES